MNRFYYLLFIFILESCARNEMKLLPIFSVDDLEICNLPLPVGYPQSQTHPGICYVGDSLCGYQYWLTSSPYPALKSGDGDAYENPMLYYANVRLNGNPPISFIPYDKNPLMERPEKKNSSSTYNSDPDIMCSNDTLYVLNRTFHSDCPIYERSSFTYNRLAVCLLKSIVVDDSLVGFETPKELLVTDALNHKEYSGTPTFISPSITYINGKFRIFYLTTNTYNDGGDCKELVMLSDVSMSGGFELKKDIKILNGNLEPWHMSVFKYKDKLYSIVCCTSGGVKRKCHQYLAEFDSSLSVFTIFQRPLIAVNSYRGSGFVREDGLFILYSSVTEFLPQSKSVDGRDVVLVTMPFDKLLAEIKSEKNINCR